MTDPARRTGGALDALLRERLDPLPASWQPTPLALAAVLAPVFARGGAEHVLCTVRPAHLARHGGQIAFPGGMAAPGESPAECALRECEEELGVPRGDVVLLGALPPRQSSTGILVHCLAARIPDPAAFRHDPHEVERLLAIPLADLLAPDRWAIREGAPQPGGLAAPAGIVPPPSPHFAFGDDVVWGLTGRFLHDLVTRLA